MPETAEIPETVCGAVSEEEQNIEVESDVAAEEAEIPVADTADNETVVRISLPTTRHNGLTIKNLMHMLYTRGELMGKATGGTFDVKEEFIRRLDIEEPKTIEEFLNLTGAFQEDTQESPFEGIEFTQEQITFTGFPDGIAEDLLDTCIKLTALINKTAIESRSVQAKQVTVENERYTFRVWLLHLGMKGREYGMARKILMRNLTGHTAFRTEADAEKAKLRAERVKAQLAAAKAEHEAESVQSDDASEGQLGQTVEVASEETAEG